MPGGYHFQLADFGLARVVDLAKTCVGSPLYMAPEIHNDMEAQTAKLDIWSLFVTLAYATNSAGFRERDFRKRGLYSIVLRNKAVQEAAQTPLLCPFKDMAEVDPSQRASAADMLDKVFDGEGRTTRPRPALDSSGDLHESG